MRSKGISNIFSGSVGCFHGNAAWDLSSNFVILVDIGGNTYEAPKAAKLPFR